MEQAGEKEDKNDRNKKRVKGIGKEEGVGQGICEEYIPICTGALREHGGSNCSSPVETDYGFGRIYRGGEIISSPTGTP